MMEGWMWISSSCVMGRIAHVYGVVLRGQVQEWGAGCRGKVKVLVGHVDEVHGNCHEVAQQMAHCVACRHIGLTSFFSFSRSHRL